MLLLCRKPSPPPSSGLKGYPFKSQPALLETVPCTIPYCCAYALLSVATAPCAGFWPGSGHARQPEVEEADSFTQVSVGLNGPADDGSIEARIGHQGRLQPRAVSALATQSRHGRSSSWACQWFMAPSVQQPCEYAWHTGTGTYTSPAPFPLNRLFSSAGQRKWKAVRIQQASNLKQAVKKAQIGNRFLSNRSPYSLTPVIIQPLSQ